MPLSPRHPPDSFRRECWPIPLGEQSNRPTLRLLLLHDDGEREFEYTTGAERALEQAHTAGWTVVSIKNDWTTVFPN